MGGLVAWSWKNLYYQKGHYDFYLARLLLLSAPLQGSCEMLRMLLMGYRPIPGGLHETSYKFLFDYLLPATYTFPSLFQLLPQFDRNPQKIAWYLNLNRRKEQLIISV